MSGHRMDRCFYVVQSSGLPVFKDNKVLAGAFVPGNAPAAGYPGQSREDQEEENQLQKVGKILVDWFGQLAKLAELPASRWRG